jgi:hypothetical protein
MEARMNSTRATIAAALLAVGLAGCMPTGPSPEALASAKQEIAGCYLTSKTHVAAAKCHNAIMARFAQGDLANVLATSRIALPEKVDNGTMSGADADAELAKVIVSVNTEDQRRIAAAAAAMPVTCAASGNIINCY